MLNDTAPKSAITNRATYQKDSFMSVSLGLQYLATILCSNFFHTPAGRSRLLTDNYAGRENHCKNSQRNDYNDDRYCAAKVITTITASQNIHNYERINVAIKYRPLWLRFRYV